ncbi:MAG: phage tail tape measure protein [Clostridia bacterium]
MELHGRFDQIKSRLAEIKKQYSDIPAIQQQIADMDNHMANQIGYQQRLTQEKMELREIIDIQKQAYNIEQKMQQLVSSPKKNKNMINELKQEHQELMKQYEAWKSVTNITQTESKYLKEQAQNFQKISAQAKAHAQDMGTLNKDYGKFSATVGNIFKYIITYQLYNRMIEGIQNAIDIMKDLDKAFTDIQMVTMDSKEQIYDLSLEYNNLAKEMGATTQEVAEGATEWLRQGKNAEETTKLLKASMTLSKVGAIESSQATELLTSALNGYKIATEDAMSVVDKISAIDLAAATSSEELATALSRTANSAADAEVSLDKLLGMIGTVSSVTRKSASTIRRII